MSNATDTTPHLSIAIDATVLFEVRKDGKFVARVLMSEPLTNDWHLIDGESTPDELEGFMNTMCDRAMVALRDEYPLATGTVSLEVVA
jgi:hypothetical protein